MPGVRKVSPPSVSAVVEQHVLERLERISTAAALASADHGIDWTLEDYEAVRSACSSHSAVRVAAAEAGAEIIEDDAGGVENATRW